LGKIIPTLTDEYQKRIREDELVKAIYQKNEKFLEPHLSKKQKKFIRDIAKFSLASS
jgi:hypothetical protein